MRERKVFDSLSVDVDPVAADLARLKRRFDPLLAGSVADLDASEAEELRLLARIHDLDDAAPPTLVWGALRGRLEDLVSVRLHDEPKTWAPIDAAA